MGTGPTDERMEGAATTFQRIKNMRFTEGWQLVNHLNLLTQLGIIEAPTE
jgi:hypothetical protein